MKINIPPAALEAGARAILREWTDLNSAEDAARAAFEAMVGAWEGAFLYPLNKTRLILPLMENSDD